MEAVELQGNFEEVHKVFEHFLEALRRDLDVHEARIARLRAICYIVSGPRSPLSWSPVIDKR